MLAILKDAAARPELFGWFGPIASHDIDSWLKQSNLRVPDDVRELWAVTGGGDFFDEGETLLRPTEVQSSEPYFIESTDFIDLVNQFWTSNGMSTDYLPFHRGTFQTAIRLSDQSIVILDSSFRLIEAFSHLDDWYLSTLRHAYADVYGFGMS
jgi:hypothetical protein